MTQEVVEVLAERPNGMSPWAFIQFGADYSAEHPVWTLGGLADLESMRLPSSLETRLQRWASYWDSHQDFETGWPDGFPEAWWLNEQSALPHDLALTIGSAAVVISVEGQLLRSQAQGTSPGAAAAMRSHIIEGEAEDQRFAEARSNGAVIASNIECDSR